MKITTKEEENENRKSKARSYIAKDDVLEHTLWGYKATNSYTDFAQGDEMEVYETGFAEGWAACCKAFSERFETGLRTNPTIILFYICDCM